MAFDTHTVGTFVSLCEAVSLISFTISAAPRLPNNCKEYFVAKIPEADIACQSVVILVSICYSELHSRKVFRALPYFNVLMEYARGVVGAEGGGSRASVVAAPGSRVKRTAKWAAKLIF